MGLEKNSMVNVVLGRPSKVPSRLITLPLVEDFTALENSEVFPLGSVAVAETNAVPDPAVSAGAF